MEPIQALIIDDETHPRKLLQGLLKTHFPEIELIAVCDSALMGIEETKKHSINLIFLDVEMPAMNGFQFLEAVAPKNFEVIFTTSYAKYALDAIKFSALDYILKPIELIELQKSIDRYKSRPAKGHSSSHIENLLKNLRSLELGSQKIALPTSSGYVFIRVSDIIRCESENVYTTFFLRDKNQIVVSRSMKECEEMLQLYRFQRIHQSHLINMQYIKRYKKGDGGEVEMEDGSVLEVSRRKKEEFIQLLNKL